jgi:Polyketide cyclase / dehydrase and lipid transport
MAATLLLLPVAGFCGDTGGDWQMTSHSTDLSIFSRVRDTSGIREYKAVGKINAPPKAVMAVLNDIDAYPDFMPYMKECRVIKHDGDSIISYQRISPPFCTDRDYSIRVRHETKTTAVGDTYVCRWEAANPLGPAELEDVLRVKINEGSWFVEPGGANATRATYCIYTDSGGALPAWLAAKANQIAIGKLFDAVRKQVKNSKYAAAP